MEENKVTNPETPEEQAVVAEVESANAESTEKKAKKKFTLPKFKKSDKIKNQALLKRGSYAIIVTAVVLVGIIAFNVLLSVLSNRFMLEYDMTSDKINTISEDNVRFIKKIDNEVTVTMCAKAADYYGGYMNYYAQNLYGLTEDYSNYYKQTVSLIEKYNNYNNKIKVNFVDTQDSSFTEITSKYSKEKLNYGDIIVSCETNGNERYKIIGFKDIYSITEDDTYAAYGYTMSSISGNNIETALTSAIAYATSSEVKKAAFITGHSKEDLSETYRELLKTNNYEVEVIDDSMVSKISSEYDAVFIIAPTIDFLESELDALSNFLDNDEKYDKGLVFFGDASAPYLPNLYSFLEQWGIEVGEGILFETNTNNHMPDTPTVLGSYPGSEDEITNNIEICITGYNVPMQAAFSEDGTKKVTSLVVTPDTVVGAPVGTSDSWKGAGKYEKGSYSTVIQCERSSYDDDNNLIKNNVIALSSYEFIHSEYAEHNSVGNKNIAFAVAERAVGAEDSGISFVSKVITNESFSTSVTQTSVNLVTIIFMVALPVLCIAAGIYVYIRRKNA